MTDTELLEAILQLDTGSIANTIQAAAELEGSMHERLAKGYAEITA